ncbi:MAG: trypsin-like peptidase domain-containing protein [Candidatus Omnitrophica bacterium]|nr:trypsin-like peptidase domain-containing protein [Candidatus Omnitrophota bacterium]
MKRWFLILLLLLIAQAFPSVSWAEQANSSTVASNVLEPEETKRIALFEQLSPSVVFIKNSSLQWDIFSLDVYAIPSGAGSGFVWDKEGHIITNFHVVYGADRIEVAFADRKTYEAKVVGISPDHDIAVLKIDAPVEELKPIPVGSSNELKIGQKTLVIGNPFGLDHSLSTGVVSALGRSINSITGRKINNMIQTDAAINPGNSGGPLLDSSGRLIGVTAAIVSPSGVYTGVGFAIPVDTIKRIVPQLIEFGRVKQIGIGVTLIPDSIRDRIGIEGALVMDVLPSSTAEKVGLVGTKRNFLGSVFLGDLIVSIDGKKISSNEDLAQAVEDRKAGDKINVEFIREERKKSAAIELMEY